jgi:hypothetical protein
MFALKCRLHFNRLHDVIFQKTELLRNVLRNPQILHMYLLSCQLSANFLFVCEAIGTAATPGLLCQPRVIVKMIVEKEMECRLGGETEVLGENLPQRHFCPSQNPTLPDPGFEPRPPRWEVGD